MRKFGTPSFEWPMLSVVAAVTLVTACGDVDTYSASPASWGETEALTSWHGTYVELVRATTPCDSQDNQTLIVPVGAQLEFPGEQVAKLKSSCSSSTEAEVSIDVGERSIVYDFSSVTKAGVFTEASFNGYVFTELAGAAPELLSATVDRELSTLELEEGALDVDEGVLRANFEGIEFDDRAFVKIDLVFADAAQP